MTARAAGCGAKIMGAMETVRLARRAWGDASQSLAQARKTIASASAEETRTAKALVAARKALRVELGADK